MSADNIEIEKDQEHKANLALVTEWIGLNRCITKREVFQTIIKDQALENIDEINNRLKEDITSLFNVFLNDINSIENAMLVKPNKTSNLHLQLRIWAYKDINLNSIERLLTYHKDDYNLIVYFIRFNTEMDMEPQIDSFEDILNILEIVKDKPFVIVTRLFGNEICSLEQSRLIIECVRRVYEEGFNVVRTEFEFDSNIFEMNEEWSIIHDTLEGTTDAGILIRKYQNVVNIDLAAWSLSDVWNNECFIQMDNAVLPNFIYPGVECCELELLEKNTGLVFIEPKNKRLILQFHFSSLQSFLLSLKFGKGLKQISFTRFSETSYATRFSEHEQATLLTCIRNLLAYNLSITDIMIDNKRIAEYNEQGKQIYDTYLLSRQKPNITSE